MATNVLTEKPMSLEEASTTLKMAPGLLKSSQLKSDVHPDWCPGCGDFGIVNAVQQAMAGLQIAPWETMFFTGVGCSGKSSHYINSYGCHTLHGRVLPYALGAKLSNPKLTVVAAGGDGDGLGIGMCHFVHAGRRNIDITYVIYNNEVYGLTKGQASPTLAFKSQPKSLPLPNINKPVNPLAMAIASGYTFVARSYAYDAKHLAATLQAAIAHKGMALVDVLQPCPTYNDIHTKEFYSTPVQTSSGELPRTYKLDEAGYDGRVQNPFDEAEVESKRLKAIERAYLKEERVGLGVYWQIEMATYGDLLKDNLPLLQEYTPINLPYYDPKTMKPTTDLTPGLEEFLI
ncbi:MAG: thiamine pyrophosphate-dependent enzyme [Vampirovibrionales bacterium]|nr:thiamine pyrophosphate-dependent enzyme [Vampirovibrionales bacterium]